MIGTTLFKKAKISWNYFLIKRKTNTAKDDTDKTVWICNNQIYLEMTSHLIFAKIFESV